MKNKDGKKIDFLYQLDKESIHLFEKIKEMTGLNHSTVRSIPAKYVIKSESRYVELSMKNPDILTYGYRSKDGSYMNNVYIGCLKLNETNKAVEWLKVNSIAVKEITNIL